MTDINIKKIDLKNFNIEETFKPEIIFSNSKLLQQLSADSKLFKDAELCKMGMLNGFYSNHYTFTIDDKSLAHAIIAKNDINTGYLSDSLKNDYQFIKEFMIANPSKAFHIFSRNDILPNMPCKQEDFFKEMCELIKTHKLDFQTYHLNKYNYEYNDEIASLIIDYLAPMVGYPIIGPFKDENPDFMNNKFIIELYKKSIEFGNSHTIWRDCDINDELVNAVLDINPYVIFNTYKGLSKNTIIKCITKNSSSIIHLDVLINEEIVFGVIEAGGIKMLNDATIKKYKDAIIVKFPHLVSVIESDAPKESTPMEKLINYINAGDIKLEHLSDSMRKQYIDATTDFNNEAQMLALCKKDKSYCARLGDKLKNDATFLMKLITELNA